jgi:hypothetical protein
MSEYNDSNIFSILFRITRYQKNRTLSKLFRGHLELFYIDLKGCLETPKQNRRPQIVSAESLTLFKFSYINLSMWMDDFIG